MDFEVINVNTKEQLLNAIAENQENDYRFGAGYTDLINQFKTNPIKNLTVINITSLNDSAFNSIIEQEDYVMVGALITASDLIDSTVIQEQYPVLHLAASSVASIQIRNSATIGGNICNASPSADMSAALIALNADCVIINAKDESRREPLNSFIEGVGKTSLKKDEILQHLLIPVNKTPHIKSGFEKIGTRNSMEISIVSLSYHIQCDAIGTIEHAGISCGAVAPTIPFTTSACQFLVGMNWNAISETDKEQFANKVVEYACPISDIRASEWYRREVLFNISKTIF